MSEERIMEPLSPIDEEIAELPTSQPQTPVASRRVSPTPESSDEHFNFENSNGILSKHLLPAKSSIRPSLNLLRFSLANYQTSLHALANDAQKYLDTLKEACESTETLVSDQVQKLHKNIEERKEKILQEMKQKREQEESSIQQHLEDLTATEQHMSKTAEFLETVTTYASDIDLKHFPTVTKHKDHNKARHHNRDVHAISSKEDGAEEKHIGIHKDKGATHRVPHKDEEVNSKSTEDDHAQKSHPHHAGHTAKHHGYHIRDSKIIKTVPTRRKSKSYAIILSRFNTDESLTALTTTVDDTVAVTTYSSKKCSIYTLEGNLKCEINKGLIQPISVASLVSGKLLIADAGDGSRKMGLKMFYTDGEAFPTHLSVSEAVWGMAETGHGDLVVCHPEKTKVCMYDRKGRTKMTMKSLGGQSMFVNPRCVCININGDIVVSDFERHCVLVFDSEGTFKFTFGSEGKGTKNLNHPCGVCADRAGNLIIADSDNHRISLISSEGKFIKYLLTHHDGLDEPVAVALTKENKLIVGEWSGKITVAKYDVAEKTPVA